MINWSKLGALFMCFSVISLGSSTVNGEPQDNHNSRKLRERRQAWDEWIESQRFSNPEKAQVAEIREWIERENQKIDAISTTNWRMKFLGLNKLKEELKQRLNVVIGPERSESLGFDDVLVVARPPWLVSVKAESSVLLKTDLEDDIGTLSSETQGFSLGLTVFPIEDLTLNLSLAGGYTDYHFDDALSLDPRFGDPIDEASSLKLSVSMQWQVTGKWTMLFSASSSGSAEERADFEDSIVYGGLFGASYRLSKQLQIGLGVFARTRLEDDVNVFPIPLIRYELEFNEIYKLIIGLPDGVKVVASVAKTLSVSAKLGASGALNFQDTRLDNKGFAPKGILRQTAIPITLGVDWRAHPVLSVNFELGVILYQKLEIDDRNGRSLTDVTAKPQTFLSVSVKLRF